nr:hypothetical protein [Aquibacillus kalidii]
MQDVIRILAEIVNMCHDMLIELFKTMGFSLTDKQLHFWIIGFIGLFSFFIIYFVFKWIQQLKWSTTIISFIYTFTMMVVLVFAIEIQQAITNRGNMEFADAVVGLWGFIVFFLIYVAIALFIYVISYLYNKRR